ncbi:MAG: hypothetical protein PF588_06940 [Candidatus Kapabacteria bacterium]|nr:hypothetical protein [Candidatus Kapabacteria bacterium]
MNKLIMTLTILILSVPTAFGQSYEPLDLAKKIFGKDSLANIGNYITGEYTGRPNGQDIAKNMTTKFTLLAKTDKTAVVSMTILDSAKHGFDGYLHFEKDSVWKMSAFRALALTGIIQQMVQELEKLTPEQVDELITESNQSDNGIEMFASKDEYDFRLGNAKLIIALDDNIAAHFLKNKSKFEMIKDLASKQLEGESRDEEMSIKLVENLINDYQKILISSVSTGGYEFGNCIVFLIGGMVDNTVGYLYVKDEKDLPKMNSDRTIMIRKIADGWYIYKTT